MKFQTLIALSFCTLFVTACATTDANGKAQSVLAPVSQGYAVTALRYDAPANKSGVQSISSGDLVLQQSARSTATFRLSAPLEFTTALVAGDRFEISENEILYQANIRGYGLLYCTYKKLGKAAFSKTSKRACLRDSDSDGKIDQFWATDEQYASQGVYSVFALYMGSEIDPPVAFSSTQPNVELTENFGIDFTYTKALFGDPRVTLRHIVIDQYGNHLPTNLGQEEFKLDDSISFPKVVSIAGAKINLIEIVDAQLKYEIIEGFPKNGPAGIMVPQSPKTTVVYVPGY